jgi:hypothetical protein
MSSTPQESSSGAPRPSDGPTVEEEKPDHSEPEDLEAKLELVATRSPI